MTVNQKALLKAQKKLRNQLQLELCLRAKICPRCGKKLVLISEEVGPANYKIRQKKLFCKTCSYKA